MMLIPGTKQAGNGPDQLHSCSGNPPHSMQQFFCTLSHLVKVSVSLVDNMNNVKIHAALFPVFQNAHDYLQHFIHEV